jgi:nitric oxide dioxygenase
MIGGAVSLLDKPDELIPVVTSLGRRHAGYGVEDGHYETVGAALLWTLEKGLGADFTLDVEHAWATTYEVLSNTMKAAASSQFEAN